MSLLEKPFVKKSLKKSQRHKIKVKMPLARTEKPLARNVNLILTKKLGLEWTINGFVKPLRINSALKTFKKTEVKLPHVNKKPHRESEF